MSKLIFDESNVMLGVQAEGWEDAVRKVGGMLVKNGCAKESYVEGIIKGIGTYGPYIVLADGFAMPHARPEEGALKMGYALMTLKTPVDFDENTKGVQVMIAFSAVDSDSHLELIRMIAEMIEQDLVFKLAKVQNLDELHQVLDSLKAA